MPQEPSQDCNSAAASKPLAGVEKRAIYLRCLTLACTSGVLSDQQTKQADEFYDALVAKCGEPE